MIFVQSNQGVNMHNCTGLKVYKYKNWNVIYFSLLVRMPICGGCIRFLLLGIFLYLYQMIRPVSHFLSLRLDMISSASSPFQKQMKSWNNNLHPFHPCFPWHLSLWVISGRCLCTQCSGPGIWKPWSSFPSFLRAYGTD